MLLVCIHPAGIKKLVGIAVSWAAIMGVFVLASFIAFPQTIIGWFTSDANIIATSTVYLIIVGVDLFPKSGNILVGAGVKGHGDTRWMLFTQFIGTIFVISMSALMVLVLHLGIGALFCLVVADETLRCTLNTFKLRRISRGDV